MEKKAKCIEVRTSDGKTIFSLYLYEKEAALEDDPKAPVNQQDPKKEKGNDPPNDEPKMTDAQKRFLFRILADQGTEGDKAHEKLKELFQVESLKDVSKLEASRMIERLLAENKGGSKDDHAHAPF
jgi:hypothetical protein